MGFLVDEDGQASIEQVGLIALIALVFAAAAGAAAAFSPGIRERVESGFLHALCVVAGQGCDALAREPCPTLRTARTTSQGLAVGFVRLGHDRVLLIERRSDGSYVMSQIEGTKGGAAIAHGVTKGQATVGAEASLLLGRRAGRTYEAATPQEARRLVERLRGETLPAVQSVVIGAADLAGLVRADPAVTSYVLAGDGAAEALAQFGLGGVIEGGAEGRNHEELGVRIAAHRREITAYASLDARAGVFFDALSSITVPVGGAARPKGGPDTATLDNPLDLGVDGAGVVGGSVALRFGPGPTLLGAEIVGYAGDGSSQREVRARLDPTDPVIRAALDAWRKAPTSPAAIAALGRASRARASVDVRTFKTTRSEHVHGGQASIAGLALGGEFGSEGLVSELVEQRSRIAGGAWEQRTDCMPIASA